MGGGGEREIPVAEDGVSGCVVIDESLLLEWREGEKQ